MMVDDDSSGKRTIDDEQRFKKIEKRLNGINETLRSLTQMEVFFTIEGKREPMKQRPDQHGDQQQDDYNDQRWPQIGSKINGGGAIHTNPTTNRNFREPYPLRVYERQNRGAPRHHDDNKLQRGVFYEQYEFCPPFRDGDDFRLPQWRNIQQRQQRRLDYSFGKEDDFHFYY